MDKFLPGTFGKTLPVREERAALVRAVDEALAREETVTIAVQVNGKTRGTIAGPPDLTQEHAVALAMAEPGIAKFVTGPIRKVIFVPGRLLSLVV